MTKLTELTKPPPGTERQRDALPLDFVASFSYLKCLLSANSLIALGSLAYLLGLACLGAIGLLVGI